MRKIGMYLALFGIGSIVLNLLGREFVILMWVDMFGETIGWAIRLGMIVGGAVMFFMGSKEEEEEEDTFSEEDTGSDETSTSDESNDAPAP